MQLSGATKTDEQIQENIDAVSALYARAEKELPLDQRRIEAVVAALGRPRFLYLYLAGVLAWIIFNVVARRMGLEPFDEPPFFWLQGSVTASALLMAIVILIAQNRQGRLAERRDHLELQVNLLAERKITKVIELLEELRRDIPHVKRRIDLEADAMARPADPHEVAAAVEAEMKLDP